MRDATVIGDRNNFAVITGQYEMSSWFFFGHFEEPF